MATTNRGIVYEVTGEDGRFAPPPLLLLHGFTGSAANWRHLVPAFAQSRRVITLDIIGHGRSPSPPDPAAYTMPHAAADILAVLDALEVAQVDLLGYSMGGRLALFTAVHHPDRIRRLILESASPGLPTAAERAARRQRDNDLADWIETNTMPAFVDRWESLPLWASQHTLPPKTSAALRSQRLTNTPTGLANSLRGMGTGAQPSLWPNLAALNIPTLLIAGELDSKFVGINREMAQQIPAAVLQIIADAGHTVHLERPSTYQQTVLTFLQQATNKKPG